MSRGKPIAAALQTRVACTARAVATPKGFAQDRGKSAIGSRFSRSCDQAESARRASASVLSEAEVNACDCKQRQKRQHHFREQHLKAPGRKRGLACAEASETINQIIWSSSQPQTHGS